MNGIIAQPPRFISLEGGEGAGKSTQIKLLYAWLTAQGIDVCLTREPGGSPGAEEIRALLLKGAGDRWTAMTEALLMVASRAEHIDRTIKPAMAAGQWVLCDRFADSSVAYQGAGRELGVARIRALQHYALNDFVPDLTLILDLPIEVGLGRAIARENEKSDMEDRFERLDKGFHERLRTAFLDIAQAEPDRCRLVNADQELTVLQAELQQVLLDKFGKK